MLASAVIHLESKISKTTDPYTTGGQHIENRDHDFGIGTPYRGVLHHHGTEPLPTDKRDRRRFLENYPVGQADIEVSINEMLGREP